MARTIGIGHQDFGEIRENNLFYIDKTDFLKEWWENHDSVTLITRPRRFGKSLAMSMAEHFFSVKYAGKGEVFEGLAIWEDKTYQSMQGTWPVISLSFANVKERDYVSTVQKINQIIADLYNDNRFLLQKGILSEEESRYFQSVSMQMSEVIATLAIHRLSKFLYYFYQKKVIILLDEYDAPMQEAYMYGYWEELSAFTRSMFHAAFKTNPYMERAIMTGITRVGKESIFSDLNNLEVITVASEKYADSFGFSEREVFDALDEYGLSDRKEEVKSWYDGFTFGNKKDIYNPWSILHYLDKRRLDLYWANSSSNSLVGKLLSQGDKNIKRDFESLMRGEAIRCRLDEQIVYNQLSVRKNAVWSLLLASGYLRVICTEFEEQSGHCYYRLALTNREVRLMFEDMIHDWFLASEDEYNDFIKALLLGDVDAMNVYMNKVALATFSYFDVGKRPSFEEPERFYHGFVLGLMVELSGRYVLMSNRESRFGRYDVMLEPKRPDDDAIILEFKVQDTKEEKGLADTVQSALHQIDSMNYEAALIAKGIQKKRIRKYGFAFCGKTVLIG